MWRRSYAPAKSAYWTFLRGQSVSCPDIERERERALSARTSNPSVTSIGTIDLDGGLSRLFAVIGNNVGTQNYNSYLDWYADSQPKPMIGNPEPRRSAIFDFAVIKTHLTEVFPDPPTPDLSVQLIPSGVRFEIHAEMGHGRFVANNRGANQFCVGTANIPLALSGMYAGLLTVFAITWQSAQDRLQSPLQSPVEHLGKLHTRMNEDGAVRMLIDAIWKQIKHDEHLGRLVVDDLANELLIRLVTLSGQRIPQVTNSCRLSTRQLCDVVDFMVAHLGEFIELDQLAVVVGVSRFQLCRLFKNSTGQSPARYLRCLRIEQAERMLLDNRNRPLIEVALQCGFCDQSHFNRVFKSILARWRTEADETGQIRVLAAESVHGPSTK